MPWRRSAPVAWKIDKGIADSHWPLLERMAAGGFLCLGIPEEYGGCGLDALTTAIVVEELAAADAGYGFTATLNSHLPVMVAGTEEQKRAFLPRICDRTRPGLSAFALTEPGAGSDAGAVRTTALKDGDQYVVNGEKCFISNGDSASLYTIFATVDRSRGVKGITAFLMTDEAEGLNRGKVEDKMGFRTSRTGVFSLNDVRIPETSLLGKEGAGFGIAMRILDVLRVLSCGAVGVGVARRAFECAARFWKTRADSRALAANQAVTFALADMLAEVEAARLMVWRSAWMIDQKQSVGTMSSLTKFFVSDRALQVAQKGLELVGPEGYGEEYPLEKLVRDAKLLQIYEGTNQISRMVAARAILAG